MDNAFDKRKTFATVCLLNTCKRVWKGRILFQRIHHHLQLNVKYHSTN